MDAVFAHFGRTFAEPCTLAHRRERLLALAIPHHVLNTDVTLYIGHRQWLPVSSSGDPRDGPRRSRTRGEPHQFGIDPAPWAAQRSCKAVLMHNLLRIESEEQALLAAACGADFDSAVESKWFIPSTKREHDSGPSSPTAAAAATRPVKAKARTGRSGGGRRPKKKTQPTAMPGEANLQGQDRVSSSFDVEAMERALSAASIDDDDEVLDPKSDSMNKTEVLLLFCRNGPLHADSVQKAQLRIDAALTVGRSAERDIAFMPHSISFLSLADVRLRHQSLASLFDAKKQLTSTQIRHLVQEYGATGVFQFVLERQFRRENHGARLDATRARQRIVSDTDEIAEMVQFCAWLDACDALRIICDYAPPAMVRAALAPTAETGADPTCAPLWLSVSKSAPCTIELLARGADATELHGAANHTRRALLPLACQHEEGYAALTYLLNLKSTRDVSAASQDGADAGSRDVECVPGASQLPATKTTTPVPRTTDEEASHADQEQCRGIPATLPASGATATPVNATIEFPRFTSPAGAQTAKDKLDHEFNFALLHLSSERRRRLAAARAALLATINDTGGVEGFTPLIEAARWGPYELCQLLLAHGADPSVEGTAGLTAVAYAEDRGQ